MKKIVLIIIFLIPAYCISQISTGDSAYKNIPITVKIETVNLISSIDKANNIEPKSNNSLQIYSVIINAGILILVAILGAYFHKRTQFESFLFQKRIEVYSTFLSESEKCQRDAYQNILMAVTNKEQFDKNQIPWITAKIFWPMTISQFAVKLLLDKEHKIRFEQIMEKLPKLTIHDFNLTKGEEPQIGEIENSFKEIESILEQSITSTKSFLPKIKQAIIRLFASI